VTQPVAVALDGRVGLFGFTLNAMVPGWKCSVALLCLLL